MHAIRSVVFAAAILGLMTGWLIRSVSPSAPNVDWTARVQQDARQLAESTEQQHPGAVLAIIVLDDAGQGSAGEAETLVSKLGGHVVRDLGPKGGFAAVLPAHALSTLASSPAVRWVTLDATIASLTGEEAANWGSGPAWSHMS